MHTDVKFLFLFSIFITVWFRLFGWLLQLDLTKRFSQLHFYRSMTWWHSPHRKLCTMLIPNKNFNHKLTACICVCFSLSFNCELRRFMYRKKKWNFIKIYTRINCCLTTLYCSLSGELRAIKLLSGGCIFVSPFLCLCIILLLFGCVFFWWIT